MRRIIYASVVLFLVISSEGVFAQSAEEWYNKGYEKSRKGLYRNAIEDYTHAIKVNPKSPAALSGKAAADLKKAIELDPSMAEKAVKKTAIEHR